MSTVKCFFPTVRCSLTVGETLLSLRHQNAYEAPHREKLLEKYENKTAESPLGREYQECRDIQLSLN